MKKCTKYNLKRKIYILIAHNAVEKQMGKIKYQNKMQIRKERTMNYTPKGHSWHL